MASTSKEDTDRVSRDQKYNQSLHDTGGYTVKNGQITNNSGQKQSLQRTAWDARMSANAAKDNIKSGNASVSVKANKLHQDQAEYARNAIYKAVDQRKKKKK